MRNFFSKFFCPHFIDLEISLFCKQTGPRYVNKWLKQISLPFLYSPWIVETPELCYKKWPDFYLKLSRSISVNTKVILNHIQAHKVKYIFTSDLKMQNIYHGKMGHACDFPCHICPAPKWDFLSNRYDLSTYESMIWKMANRIRQKSRFEIVPQSGV